MPDPTTFNLGPVNLSRNSNQIIFRHSGLRAGIYITALVNLKIPRRLNDELKFRGGPTYRIDEPEYRRECRNDKQLVSMPK